MWDADGDLERRHLVDTYYDVMGERLPWDEYKVPMYHPEIVGEIEQIARKYNLEPELMEKLIVLRGQEQALYTKQCYQKRSH